MSNDNNELKNNAPCEEKQEVRQLTEEELEKVNGGIKTTVPVLSSVAILGKATGGFDSVR